MIGCEHKWKWLGNNCTWTSAGWNVEEKPPAWAQWHAEYQCELCGDIKCEWIALPDDQQGQIHV
jgi:hypothetical protein